MALSVRGNKISLFNKWRAVCQVNVNTDSAIT